MKIDFTVAKSTTKYLEVNLEEATHFRYNGDTYPLHSIIDRTIAATKIHTRYLCCHGKEYRLDECAPLKAVVSTTPALYKIELTEGEAEVLAEVLRHTRAGTNLHKDVTAVCNELWDALPIHSVSNATVVTGGLLHVSKSA
jgi:hypothetical protein